MYPDRTKKVKEARDEAKKEIEAYRKEKDEEFKKFESEVRLLSSTISFAKYSKHHTDESLFRADMGYSIRAAIRKHKMMQTKMPKSRLRRSRRPARRDKKRSLRVC